MSTPSNSAVYSGSVNPSRRAKLARSQPASVPTSSSSSTRTLLPKQSPPSDAPHHDPRPNLKSLADTSSVPSAPAPDHVDLPPANASATAKRGRKPASSTGAMSRSAREAQRKLNHSMIEKARRTKINDALTELARLGDIVPKALGSGSGSGPGEERSSKGDENALSGGLKSPEAQDEQEEPDADQSQDEDDDDDKDGDYGSSTRTRGGKSRSHSDGNDKTKKPPKDKFKLDILVKTVSHMHSLLKRVEELEAALNQESRLKGASSSAACDRCAERERQERKVVEDAKDKPKQTPKEEARNKRKRDERDDIHLKAAGHRGRKALHMHSDPPSSTASSSPSTSSHKRTQRPSLPSIASWLPGYVSPSLVPSSSAGSTLPSPLLIPPFDSQPQAQSQPHSRQRLSSPPSPSLLTDATSLKYLPSPPSSTQFTSSAPASQTMLMPALELGPSSVPVPKRLSLLNPSMESSTSFPMGTTEQSETQSTTSFNAVASTSASAFASSESLPASESLRVTVPMRSGSSTRTLTPEDESAASLLLHMSVSPPVFTAARARGASVSTIPALSTLSGSEPVAAVQGLGVHDRDGKVGDAGKMNVNVVHVDDDDDNEIGPQHTPTEKNAEGHHGRDPGNSLGIRMASSSGYHDILIPLPETGHIVQTPSSILGLGLFSRAQ